MVWLASPRHQPGPEMPLGGWESADVYTGVFPKQSARQLVCFQPEIALFIHLSSRYLQLGQGFERDQRQGRSKDWPNKCRASYWPSGTAFRANHHPEVLYQILFTCIFKRYCCQKTAFSIRDTLISRESCKSLPSLSRTACLCDLVVFRPILQRHCSWQLVACSGCCSLFLFRTGFPPVVRFSN